jgi:SRSO17 transposase
MFTKSGQEPTFAWNTQEAFAIPQFALTRSDIDTFIDELRGFHTALRACFARQEPRAQFFNSMVGQFSPRARKSMEPMARRVEGGNVRAMQRRVSAALGDEEARRETSQRWVQEEMDEPDGGLMVDATGFGKKGTDSVGVARPDCGPVGQGEHWPVGVCAASASRQG